jgi:hypothetical protein
VLAISRKTMVGALLAIAVFELKSGKLLSRGSD